MAGRGRICSSACFSGSGNTVIGDRTYIGSQVLLRASPGSRILIGDDCDIATRVCIWTGTHEIAKKGPRIAGPGISKDVVISNGCWLGAGVIVNAGVMIGGKSVVASGAVVIDSIPEGVLAAGVPAKVKKCLW